MQDLVTKGQSLDIKYCRYDYANIILELILSTFGIFTASRSSGGRRHCRSSIGQFPSWIRRLFPIAHIREQPSQSLVLRVLRLWKLYSQVRFVILLFSCSFSLPISIYFCICLCAHSLPWFSFASNRISFSNHYTNFSSEITFLVYFFRVFLNNNLFSPSFPSGEYKQVPWLHFVRDAVYAFAYALHNLWELRCEGQPGLCDEMAHSGHVHGREIFGHLLNVTFEGSLDFLDDSSVLWDIMSFHGYRIYFLPFLFGNTELVYGYLTCFTTVWRKTSMHIHYLVNYCKHSKHHKI